jgi:integrase/recombinase XerC
VKELVKIPKLEEEQKILSTFTAEHIKRIVHWNPSGVTKRGCGTAAMTALDTGLRLNELLTLARHDVDFDNPVLRVHGKGNKQRFVPMSIELRKTLYRYLSKHHRHNSPRMSGSR